MFSHSVNLIVTNQKPPQEVERMSFNKFFFTSLFILLTLVLGCSGKSTSPTSPGSNPDDMLFLALPASNDAPGHELAGFWKISFDFENLTASVEPQRFPDGHINVRNMLPPPQLSNISWDPITRILEVDVKITNPFPVSAYDLRAIIFTDDDGNLLLNPDGWSPLFDIPQGNFINPFIAYAKDQPNRIFEGNGTSHKERLCIYFPKGINYIFWGIDVSYPTNCDEPYDIQNFTQDVLFNTVGSTTEISIDVRDWQNNVNQVVIQAPNITGQPQTTLNYDSGDTWTGTLFNGTGINPGTYKSLVAATSTGAMVPYYEYVDIVITAKQLWVYPIDGADEILESTCEQYSVEAIGDTGIIYNWTVNPPTAGYFEDPSAASTNFCANPVDVNTLVTLQVEVNSDHGGPKFKAKEVTIINQGIGWPAAFGGTGDDQAWDTCVDSKGNVYVTGWFSGTVDFDPGAPGPITSLGGTDGFLSKYDSSGNFIKVIPLQDVSNEYYCSIITDNDGSCYVGGWGQEIGILYKYDSDLNYKYKFTWPSSDGARIQNLTYDGLDGIYVSGYFAGTLDLDPTPGTDIVSSSGGTYDIWIVKLNTSDQDQYQWGRIWGSATNHDFSCINASSCNEQNEIFIGGYDLNDYTERALLLKYNQNGDQLLPNFILDTIGRSETTSIALDNDSNIYLTGFFSGSTDFDPSGGIMKIDSYGETEDVFIAKYNSNAEYAWVGRWGGIADDVGYNVFIGNNQKVYVSGIYRYTVDFDPSDSGSDQRTSAGGSDIFINVLDLDGNYDKTNFPVVTLPHTGDDFINGCAYNAPFYYYFAGYFTGTMDFDPDPIEVANRTSNGGNDAYATKMDLNGHLVKY